jgi:hypothetical protein
LDTVEAVDVLREIYAAIPEFGCSANFTSLDPNQVKITQGLRGFYELRIKVNLDSRAREEIVPILRTHKLDMTEKRGSLVIF